VVVAMHPIVEVVAVVGGSMVEVRAGDSSLVVEVVAERHSILLGVVDSLAAGIAVAGIAAAVAGQDGDDLSTDLGILQTF